jgi:hypothetical protein
LQVVISGIWDGTDPLSVTLEDLVLVGGRGGNISVVSYRDADAVVDVQVSEDGPDTDTSHDGPSVSAASGEVGVALFVGRDASNSTTWGGGYTERSDDEFHGINTIGDKDGPGTLTPSITTSVASYELWTHVLLGSGPGFGAVGRVNVEALRRGKPFRGG